MGAKNFKNRCIIGVWFPRLGASVSTLGTQPATPVELELHAQLRKAMDEITALKEREKEYRRSNASTWDEALIFMSILHAHMYMVIIWCYIWLSFGF